MWKKDEESDRTPEARPDEKQPPERSASRRGSIELASIGPSISIKGEVTGDEDLVIQGRVDGSVDLKDHSITVGPEGEVKADLVGRVITVEGTVNGNINAGEQAILRSTAVVHGDIKAPRVVLEDGARFRGGVEMGEGAQRGGAASAGSGPQTRRAPEHRRPQTEIAGAPAGTGERGEKEKEGSAAEAEE